MACNNRFWHKKFYIKLLKTSSLIRLKLGLSLKNDNLFFNFFNKYLGIIYFYNTKPKRKRKMAFLNKN